MRPPQQGAGQGDAAGGLLPGRTGKMAFQLLLPVVPVDTGQFPEMQAGFLKTGVLLPQEGKDGMPQAIAGIAGIRVAAVFPPEDTAVVQKLFQSTVIRAEQGTQQMPSRIFGPHAA